MESFGVKAVAGVCLFFSLTIPISWAGNSQLEEEIKALKDRLRVLEEKLKEQEQQEASQPVLTFLKGVRLSGYLSTSVNYNFNQPDSRVNDLRIFDQDANTFNLDLFELVIKKEAESGGAGFRVDLDYGDVAESIGSTGLGSSSDEFDLQQAYISLDAPLGVENLDLIIGKFVTLLGYEVIESGDNFNTSRSFLFGYAIPFTHTGILANYGIAPGLDLSLGVVNGWDNVKDNNDAKTVLARIGIEPKDWISLGITGIYGAEQDNDNGNQRGVIDLVATIQPREELTLGLNYDYGREENAVSATQDAKWWGIAGYLRYQFTERWAQALRLEFFEDQDGTRTGTAQELWEVTLTNDYKLQDNLLLRLEYRHDDSDKNSFARDSGTKDTQDTVSLEMIYRF